METPCQRQVESTEVVEVLRLSQRSLTGRLQLSTNINNNISIMENLENAVIDVDSDVAMTKLNMMLYF